MADVEMPALGMPPMCEEPGCIRDLVPGRDDDPSPDGKYYCRLHRERQVRHPLEIDATEIAEAPPRGAASQKRLELLQLDEFAVLDYLEEANATFMSLPQVDATERRAWQDDYRHLVDRILRRAASRAYPQRFGS